jgi:hypothetical protein
MTTDLSGAAAMRWVRVLVGVFLGLSLLTLAAAYALRDHAGAVTDVVWVRGGFVAGSGLVMTLFAARAARGDARALLRLRIVSAIVVTAIVVVVAIPGLLPAWMRVEQVLCGVVLLGVVVLVNSHQVRTASSVAG